MSSGSPVVKLLKGAAALAVAGIADIGRVGNFGADHFFVCAAQRSTVALDAMLAVFRALAGRTKMLDGTVLDPLAGVIENAIEIHTFLNCVFVPHHFSCDSGRMSGKQSGDFFEIHVFGERRSDEFSLFQG